MWKYFKTLSLGSWKCERRFTSPHLWCVMCEVSGVRCHMSHVRCHLSLHLLLFFFTKYVWYSTKCNKTWKNCWGKLFSRYLIFAGLLRIIFSLKKNIIFIKQIGNIISWLPCRAVSWLCCKYLHVIKGKNKLFFVTK